MTERKARLQRNLLYWKFQKDFVQARLPLCVFRLPSQSEQPRQIKVSAMHLQHNNSPSATHWCSLEKGGSSAGTRRLPANHSAPGPVCQPITELSHSSPSPHPLPSNAQSSHGGGVEKRADRIYHSRGQRPGPLGYLRCNWSNTSTVIKVLWFRTHKHTHILQTGLGTYFILAWTQIFTFVKLKRPGNCVGSRTRRRSWL